MITPSLTGNSLGRTYCLYLLCRALGWDSETWSVNGGQVWPPLAHDLFADTCHAAAGDRRAAFSVLRERARAADLLIAVKPMPDSLGLAWELSLETGVPLVADIDDPDLEVLLARRRPIKAGIKRLLRREVIEQARRMRELLSGLTCMVSNPRLQEWYGGVLVPHVRETPRPSHDSPRTGVDVAFVGSVQPHKGIKVLRRAISALADEGFALTVTADVPRDAMKHENWVGQTTLEQGAALTARADVVAIPSLRRPWADGQLPVKLVDAMLLGRSVVVSDIPPLPWATGPAGLIARPGDVGALVQSLRVLADAAERDRRGSSLRSLAMERYTIEANTAAFESACEAAAPARSVMS